MSLFFRWEILWLNIDWVFVWRDKKENDCLCRELCDFSLILEPQMCVAASSPGALFLCFVSLSRREVVILSAVSSE